MIATTAIRINPRYRSRMPIERGTFLRSKKSTIGANKKYRKTETRIGANKVLIKIAIGWNKNDILVPTNKTKNNNSNSTVQNNNLEFLYN